MARYFAGTTLASFRRMIGTVTEGQVAGKFNATFVDRHITLPSAAPAGIESPRFTTGDDFWFRLDVSWGGLTLGTTTGMIAGYNGTTAIWRLDHNSGNDRFQLAAWNGTSMVVGATFGAISYTDLHTLVFHYSYTDKTFRCYRNGILEAEMTAIASGMVAGMTHFTIRPSLQQMHVSQVMCADYDLRASNLMNLPLNGNSAANTGQFSGAFGDINELGRDDTTNVTITVAGNKAGFTKANFTLPPNKGVGALIVSALARATGSITNGKVGLRTGGVNYSSTNLGFDAGFDTKQRLYEVDPATGVAFTQAGVNAAEVYLEAT